MSMNFSRLHVANIAESIVKAGNKSHAGQPLFNDADIMEAVDSYHLGLWTLHEAINLIMERLYRIS